MRRSEHLRPWDMAGREGTADTVDTVDTEADKEGAEDIHPPRGLPLPPRTHVPRG